MECLKEFKKVLFAFEDRKPQTMALTRDLKCIESDLNAFQSMLKRFNVSQRQVNQLIDEVFDDKSTDDQNCLAESETSLTTILNLLTKIVKTTVKAVKASLILFLVIVLICSHCPTQRFVLRNSQQLIYPVMRQLRLWTLPLIRLNEKMIGWDVEECLVENPFYGWFGVQCWPCERIHKAPDVTDLADLAKEYVNNEKPFVVRNVIDNEITVGKLIDTYIANKNSLEFGTAKVVANCASHPISNLNDLMSLLSQSLKADPNSSENILNAMKDIQIEWKMNRVEAIRVIRQVFVRPQFVPKSSEVALQRFIFIDGPQSPEYYLPKTEFANVWLTQGSGYRLIVMEPSPMCAHNCSSFSVMLGPKDTLSYNWQLYRPRSLPARIDDSDQISITFVASFY